MSKARVKTGRGNGVVVFGTGFGGFDVADTREARNLNVNQDEQRSKTEDENEDEDEHEQEDDLGRKEASRKRHTVKNRRFD